MWEYGGQASKGLAQVAKWGSARVLESELKAESRHIRTIIKSRGLWSPNVNGKTFAVFRTDKRNHLVSLVCMCVYSNSVSYCIEFISVARGQFPRKNFKKRWVKPLRQTM